VPMSAEARSDLNAGNRFEKLLGARPGHIFTSLYLVMHWADCNHPQSAVILPTVS
jgi:hypothetical protein